MTTDDRSFIDDQSAAWDYRLPGYDYDWRPTDFGPLFDLRTCILATVKGEVRRPVGLQFIDEGCLEAVDDLLVSQSLSDSERLTVGGFHPMLMGGEYLPDLEPLELEIARLALQSVTGDVLSIRDRGGASTTGYATSTTRSSAATLSAAKIR